MKQREIAAYFGVTVRTVRNWEKEKPMERKKPERKSKLDAFRPFIQALVHDDPDMNGELKKLYAFVMVLGYSRKPFVRFTTDMKSPVLLACHERAFSYFGGLTEEILYDNMKTALCDNIDDK